VNEILPQPPKPKKYEYRGGTCPKHGNACAMRRCRLTLGPWECVECAHEAGALKPTQDFAPAASSLTEQTPPAIPHHAVEVAPPADEAERGGGAACSNAGWQGAVLLRDQLDRALRRYDYGKLTDADLGIELLRISNELATESKRLRAPVAPPEAAALCQEADELRKAARELTAPMHRADDACARTALEAFHARQQPAPAPAFVADQEAIEKAASSLTEPCKCWRANVSGHRIVNRYCRVEAHASEWQTLAEQRSELHEDGTPRAGCGYCASTPELDARERGLR
jgi:hypothetical protein